MVSSVTVSIRSLRFANDGPFDDLQRDDPDQPDLSGDIHHAAPAFTDALRGIVTTGGLAGRFGGRTGEVERERATNGFGLRSQRRSGLIMREEPVGPREVRARLVELE